MKTTPLFSLLTAALLAAAAPAQTINRLVPEAAAPNDVLIIEGTNLGNVNNVEFTAVVGGFVGIRRFNVMPTSVSANRVVVQVPLVNGFAPANATPPGDPLGSLRVQDTNGRNSNSSNFYFMEATFGAITTLGTGTTQPGGIGKPVAGFTLAGGAPTVGNASFTPTLGNPTVPGVALFALGFPATPPFPMIGDGTIVIDQTSIIGVVIVPIGLLGQAQLPVPIPSTPFNATLLIQWAVLSPAGVFLSNGLQFNL